jgi:hypothetical protein
MMPSRIDVACARPMNAIVLSPAMRRRRGPHRSASTPITGLRARSGANWMAAVMPSTAPLPPLRASTSRLFDVPSIHEPMKAGCALAA